MLDGAIGLLVAAWQARDVPWLHSLLGEACGQKRCREVTWHHGEMVRFSLTALLQSCTGRMKGDCADLWQSARLKSRSDWRTRLGWIKFSV